MGVTSALFGTLLGNILLFNTVGNTRNNSTYFSMILPQMLVFMLWLKDTLLLAPVGFVSLDCVHGHRKLSNSMAWISSKCDCNTNCISHKYSLADRHNWESSA